MSAPKHQENPELTTTVQKDGAVDIAKLVSGLREHDDEHESEEWLISYADMMTLLFGLFVMLYSLAMEHKGDIDGAIKQISVGDKGGGSTEDAKGAPSTAREKELSQQIETFEKMRSELLFSIASRDNEIDDLRMKTQTQVTELNLLQTKLSLLNTAKVINPSLTPTTDPTLLAAKQALEIERAELKEEKDKLVANSKKEKQSANSNLREKQTLKGSLEDTLKEKETLSATVTAQTAQLGALATEKSQLSDEIIALKAKLASENASFLMVVLKWNTDKHDLDLKVRDPKGVEFDFKNRTRKGSQGNLLVDSRTGPGVELWQTPQLLAGTYTVKVGFYNDYGNAVPAEFEISVVTKKGVFKAGKARLALTQGQRVLKVTASPDGAITLN